LSVECAPRRRNNRVSDRAQERDDPEPTTPAAEEDNQGSNQPDHGTTTNVAWIVQAHEDSGNRDDSRPGEEKHADPPPAYQGNGESDREGRYRMVARK